MIPDLFFFCFINRVGSWLDCRNEGNKSASAARQTVKEKNIYVLISFFYSLINMYISRN